METAIMVYYDGEILAFCSKHCLERFTRDPEAFAHRQDPEDVARAS